MDRVKVTIAGKARTVVIPSTFAEREELALAWHEAEARGGVTQLRAGAAILGLCTSVGTDSGLSYAKHRYDALAYGGAVYDWLRKQGAAPGEVLEATGAIRPMLMEATFPRQVEVEADAGNSEGPAA